MLKTISSAVLVLSLLTLAACGSTAQSQPLVSGTSSAPAPEPSVTPTPKPTPTPTGPKHYHLSEVAQRLAVLKPSIYLQIQKKWVGDTTPACNYFVIAAMGEDHYFDPAHAPDLLAADFDTYLLHLGWREIDLTDLRMLFLSGADFDVIGQRDPNFRGSHGHVLIPTGLDWSGEVVVAEGELGTVTNQLISEPNSYFKIEGGMRFYIHDGN